MNNWDHIKGYKDQIKSGEVIASVWSYEDVIYTGEDIGVTLTKEEAMDILSIIDHRHDAEIGINWGVIQTHIEMSDIDYPPVTKCSKCGETSYGCECEDMI